ncbi:SurA N-terminal domain-containing protein [Streptomyces sp. NBC_00536]|uniref:SurA N-terminal domain-containing protein n=1 Tax=Streptomyces sp. NBC_00536 TaxID=2975769 RepID=UPI002E822091|nr:SurA N-terminal domain-containing protein [Streptomyces sp. NBC_00536]WUC79439.1 SurA N-terminal domain-containing protein [Streptomyces sp. NBC_00536]
MHRRTALSVSAALLVAAPLLSACSSAEVRPGTAAVVGGERITTAALQAQVKDVRTAQSHAEQPERLIEASPGLERIKLGKMIQLRVLEKAADDAGLSVSTKDVEDARKAEIDRAKGLDQLEQVALQDRVPLAPDQIDGELRFRLLLGKLSERFGQDKVLGVLGKAAQDLHIDVNPRYGSWDAKQIALGDAETPWVNQKSKAEQAPAGA